MFFLFLRGATAALPSAYPRARQASRLAGFAFLLMSVDEVNVLCPFQGADVKPNAAVLRSRSGDAPCSVTVVASNCRRMG